MPITVPVKRPKRVRCNSAPGDPPVGSGGRGQCGDLSGTLAGESRLREENSVREPTCPSPEFPKLIKLQVTVKRKLEMDGELSELVR